MLALSASLCDRVRLEIEAAGGWLPFQRYMDLALYAPGLGYYSAGAAKLGSAGDFTTAPELSSLFGATLARQVAEFLAQARGDVLEIGAGSGKLARDLLVALDGLGSPPRRYLILDLSADLIERQRQCLAALPAHLRERVAWITELPERLSGVVLGNELLDALPVHLLSHTDDGWRERGVMCDGQQFLWADRPITSTTLRAWTESQSLPVPYLTEVNLAAQALVASLGARLQRGALLFIDYGFGAGEYYHPQRHQGTLMCHYRHRSHDNPFFLPGLQDITAHVDFSAIARAGVRAGLRLAGYNSQARFLANAGITDLPTRLPAGSADYMHAIAPVQKLLSPAEMGELFKVIALTRDFEGMPMGFRSGSLDRLL